MGLATEVQAMSSVQKEEFCHPERGGIEEIEFLPCNSKRKRKRVYILSDSYEYSICKNLVSNT